MLIDNNGLISSLDWAGDIDRGDSASESGRIYFLINLCSIKTELQPFENVVKLLQNDKGQWIRSPQQWTDPLDCSRDQLDPLMMAIQFYPSLYYLREKTYAECRDRMYRYPNNDIASPEHLSHFKRARWYVWVADLFTLLNAIIICLNGYSYVANDLNHIISLCYAERFGGTFISRLAARIYLKYRDYNHALNIYFHEGSGNSDLPQYYLSGLKWLQERIK
jgi:hypothetical protein